MSLLDEMSTPLGSPDGSALGEIGRTAWVGLKIFSVCAGVMVGIALLGLLAILILY